MRRMAVAMGSLGWTVIGCGVIDSPTGADNGLFLARTRRKRSRSVKIPTTLRSTHTSTQPTDFSRIRATASATVWVGVTCQGGVGFNRKTLSIFKFRAISIRDLCDLGRNHFTV